VHSVNYNSLTAMHIM